MTKTELMETYTMEQLAEMVLKLQCKIEKYRKALEDTKEERDCRIREYQNKIDEMKLEIELLSKDSISVHQEPIGIAKDLINAEGKFERRNPFEIALCGAEKTYRIFDILELRQIAEHLLIYCDYSEKNEENEEI